MLAHLDQTNAERLAAAVDKMPPQEQETFLKFLKVYNEVTFYQMQPLEWVHDVLGIDKKTIKWSLNEAYRQKGYIDERGQYTDKWDGTPDPILTMMDGLARWKDVAVISATGTGKAQPIDTPTLTPNGWVPMGTLSPGDRVIGSNGKPTIVEAVYPQGIKPTYRVHFSDETSVLACPEHLWNVRDRYDEHRNRPWRTMTTQELLDQSHRRWHVPLVDPVEFDEKTFELDPYVLGVLLGDGGLTNSVIVSTADSEILGEIEKRTGITPKHRSAYDYAITTDRGKVNPILESVRRLGLSGKKSEEKWIPQEYLFGSVEQRTELLQGLLDTDGTIDRNGNVSFSSTSEQLSLGVCDLVRSLGGIARLKKREIRNGLPDYRVGIVFNNDVVPFKLRRKKERIATKKFHKRRAIVKITEETPSEQVCIKVSAPDSLYVTENYTITHNTFIAAVITLWFLDVYPKSLVMTVAPKEDQLKLNLWKEINELFDKFAVRRPEAIMMDLKIQMSQDRKLKGWIARGFVAAVKAGEEVSSKAAGVHAEHMLWIIDETQGVSPAILETIENTLTAPHNIRLALGNPDSKVDSLAQLYFRKDFIGVQASGYDHPNIVSNDEKEPLINHKMVVPGAVSWKSIFARRNKYGPDEKTYNAHPLYRSRVRGIIPTGSVFGIFGASILEYMDEWFENTKPKPIEETIHVPKDEKVLEGYTRIWARAKHTHISRYLLFCDVGGDSGIGDWHACIVYDRIEKAIVATIHMRGHRKEYVSEILRVANMYKIYDWEEDTYYLPIINWERNGVGSLHLVDEFAAYPYLYMHRKIDDPGGQGKVRMSYGWYTSRSNRKEMVDELKDWSFIITTKPERLPDEDVFNEIKTFVYNPTKKRYEAADGHHDDFCMALAGALITDTVLPRPIPIREAPDDELVQVVRKREKEKKRVLREIKRSARKRKGNSWDNAKLPTWGRQSRTLGKTWNR